MFYRYRSAYGASKHALQAWCDSARAELANKHIKVTVVNPGYIKTALSLNALTGDGQNYGGELSGPYVLCEKLII